jgi:predicted DNA-binding protein with PD1-like motif
MEDAVKNKLLRRRTGRTYAIVMETGDEVVGCLAAFARDKRLSKAEFKGLGGLREVLLGCFEVDGRPLVSVPLSEPVGVTSLVGNIAMTDGEPKVDPHAVIRKADGSAWGGRLLQGHACPSLKILLSASD